MSSQQILTAIIYDKRGRVLSIGKNSYTKTHTMMSEMATHVGLPDKIFLHAETDAILKCRNLDNAHKIFVSRLMKDGSYGLAKPCKVCQHAIEKAGIKIIEHT